MNQSRKIQGVNEATVGGVKPGDPAFAASGLKRALLALFWAHRDPGPGLILQSAFTFANSGCRHNLCAGKLLRSASSNFDMIQRYVDDIGRAWNGVMGARGL